MFGLFKLISEQSNAFVLMGTIATSAIIVIAGSRLSKFGDKLADISGLSSSWIGMILLATITSIPELASSVTASVSGVVDIGLGNVFGSNMFNMFIIALLDFLQGPGPVLLSVSATQILPAALGILLMAIAIGGIYTAHTFSQDSSPAGFIWGWVFSMLILFTWLVGAYISYRSEQTTVSDEEFARKARPRELRNILAKFTIAGVIVILMGIVLIGFAKELAARTYTIGSLNITLGDSFVGTIVVALVTSLPEVVVSISAYRIGAVNMAIANLFGSNTFNIVLIPIMDIVNGKQGLLAQVNQNHIITASFAMIMTTIAIMGVVYRSRKSFLYLGWDALSILGFYLLGTYLIFTVTIRLG